MDQSITIEDVAKLAGVSRATAGRVVGGYGNTSEKSKQKVLAAVKELNYRPNLVAQGLRGQSTKTIAVILGSIHNNYCSRLISAIEREARKNGFHVIICNTNESVEQEICHLQNMYSRNVDGIILMSACKSDQEIAAQCKELYQGDTPIVFVDRKVGGLESSVIQSNNEESSYEATKYLIDLGHRNIGVLATDHFSTVNERIDGYRRALNEADIAFDMKKVFFASQSEQNESAKATGELLKNDSISALYILNNSLCIGALSELKRQKKRIPDDLSILAWDDEEMNDLLDITTIVQPIDEIGKLAIDKLINYKVRQEKIDLNAEVLKTHFIFRKSCTNVS